MYVRTRQFSSLVVNGLTYLKLCLKIIDVVKRFIQNGYLEKKNMANRMDVDSSGLFDWVLLYYYLKC